MNESTKRVLLISNSTLHGSGYLDHAENEIRDCLGAATQRVLFVPYALYDRDAYAATASERFKRMGYELASVHRATARRRYGAGRERRDNLKRILWRTNFSQRLR